MSVQDNNILKQQNGSNIGPGPPPFFAMTLTLIDVQLLCQDLEKDPISVFMTGLFTKIT